ncbi:hypothetical protein HDV05_003369 [Chytridiales sp. JEL 0842]|nr:hypothetical protein HDV05_003369 [Chytridiales sp. JEL 0842]
MRVKSFILLVALIITALVSFVAAYADMKKGGSGCPLAGKCPYVKEHAVDAKGEGCPLQKGGCPYYEKHKGDKEIGDTITEEDSHCPLSGKCKFYDEMKAGKDLSDIKWDGAACPLKDKCPYYKKLVESGGKTADCPLEKGCPHFKKDFEKGGHAHHAKVGDSHSKEDCPYYKKIKEKEAAAAAAEHEEL